MLRPIGYPGRPWDDRLPCFIGSVLAEEADLTMMTSDYCSSISEAVHAINGSLSLPMVLHRVTETTAHAMHARACSIRLLNTVDRTLAISGAYGLSDRYLSKGPVRVDKSEIDRQALRGEVVYVPDVGHDSRMQYPRQAAEEGIHSMLVIPLVARGSPIGVLRVYTSEARRFEQHEIDFLRVIADLGAIAIANARTYETLQRELQIARRHESVRTAREPVGARSA